MKRLDTEITTSNTIARIKLYRFEGGVPKGSHDKNTKKVATHSNGWKPEKKVKMNFAQMGQSRGGFTSFGPFLAKREDAIAVVRPLTRLRVDMQKYSRYKCLPTAIEKDK